MTALALAARVLAIACATGAAACGPTPPPQPAAQPARDLVALAPDPEDGTVGQLTVSNAAGRVDLTQARQSTSIAPGSAPAPVTTMSEADVQRVFGQALAVQPAPARHFNLYFELGSDTLTAESRTAAAEIVTLVKGRVAPDVSVIGHTDTTDDAAANAALGLRRAALIQRLLVDAGLDLMVVEVASHGEADLLVPTADNTAEPKNRRVEVTVR